MSDASTSSKMVLFVNCISPRKTQHQVQSSFLMDVVVRLCPVIVHSICIPNSCIIFFHRENGSFEVLSLQTHRHLDLQHKQHTNSCRQHVLNLQFLVSLCSLDSSDSFWLWEFLLPRVPHLLRFPFRHLHEIHQLVRCHHQLVLHLDSEFSSDLRAQCSAIPDSRLLTVLRRVMISVVHIVSLC